MRVSGKGIHLDGPGPLGDEELVRRLLSGDPVRRRRLAARLLAAAGSVGGIGRLGVAELRQLGLGASEAPRLLAALELGRRAKLPAAPPAILEPGDAYACVASELAGVETERFVVIVLDVRNRPRRIAIVARGGVDACPVDPREIFVHAVRERGTAVIVAHNHPSGDPTPSPEDIALTARLRRAGETLGVRVLDHIIVGGDGRFESFAQAGLMGRAA